MHLKLLLAVPLILLCFAIYVVAFWVLAVDDEDRITIFSLRERALAILNGKRVVPAPVTVTGQDAAD
jgi:hypothetical protein